MKSFLNLEYKLTVMYARSVADFISKKNGGSDKATPGLCDGVLQLVDSRKISGTCRKLGNMSLASPAKKRRLLTLQKHVNQP
jgi:hypothetical protein